MHWKKGLSLSPSRELGGRSVGGVHPRREIRRPAAPVITVADSGADDQKN